MQKYADDNDFANTEFFVDDGYSGTNFDHPDWQRVIAQTEEGNIGTIIVKDISKLDDTIQRLYEDSIKGKISDERFANMTANYETEQYTLESRVSEL